MTHKLYEWASERRYHWWMTGGCTSWWRALEYDLYTAIVRWYSKGGM